MSHDEHAKALGRWLDQPPGTSPPDGVDDEVVQSIFALRPDLAPAARVTPDEILASLTGGPLADISPDAETEIREAELDAEVVPFPGNDPEADTEDSEPAPIGKPKRRGRFVLWVGGTSGVGLAMVAAATLLLVAYPTLQSGPDVLSAEPAADQAASPAAAVSSSAGEAAPEPEAEPALLPSPAPSPRARPAPKPAMRPSSAQVAREEPAKTRSVEADEVYEMEEGSAIAERALIPELQNAQDGVATLDEDEADAGWGGKDDLAGAGATTPAEAPGSADAEPVAQPVAEKKADTNVRSTAIPTDKSASAWRSGVDGDTLSRMDDAIARAAEARAAGNRHEAADILDAAIQPPARAGQHIAALAASDFLAIGDPVAASSAAQRGLGLGGSGTPEHSWLLVQYGDALTALGEVAKATDAWEQASRANQSR